MHKPCLSMTLQQILITLSYVAHYVLANIEKKYLTIGYFLHLSDIQSDL